MLDKESFKRIFDANFDAIRSYNYYRCGDQDLATDIAQEVFMKLWEKTTVPDLTNIKALLYKMAGDALISVFRKNKSALKYIESLKLEFENNSPEEAMQFNQLQEMYEKALANLPEDQRVTFLMSRTEGLTYSEIASSLSLSIKTVEKRMNKALKYLRNTIQVQ